MRTKLLAAVAVAVSLSGCGTVCNLAGGVTQPDVEPRVYGGVQRDFEVLSDVCSTTFHPGGSTLSGDGKTAAFLSAILAAAFVGDPILSFVADTLTLPVTIPLQNRRIAEEEKDRSGDTTVPSPDPPAERTPQVERLPSAPSQKPFTGEGSAETVRPPSQ
jgi:uncharacterized protein YceK